MRKYMTPEQQKIWDESIKIAKGPPDMPFREEIDILSEYRDKVRDEIFYDKSILHPGTASLSWTLCSKAHHAAALASKVVDCARLRHGMEEISVHTTKQIMRTYVSVFVSTAEDSHHKKVRMETIFSFLGALQGMASISHILIQDTLALIGSKDTCSDYKIDESGIDRAHLEYQVEMNNLKDMLTSAHRRGLLDLYKILAPTLHLAVARTKTCVLKMTATRKMALGHHLPGAPKAPDDS
ncbi:hypothetical protein CFC21_019703 [Triticum aestivum]|uniref:Uncharacterized protein n=3 Tax=Triticum TaxID=4564 RepID=A0A9R1P7D0_TRITD|nr:uncharacterized protein LOC123186414 [Triticum aestivum]KAF7004497.1 hypothetical protein CFC21_019703 [Triticum aestivum]VAH38189.1 unnamed protein product [Triticum turgidum subsp. durum]